MKQRIHFYFIFILSVGLLCQPSYATKFKMTFGQNCRAWTEALLNPGGGYEQSLKRQHDSDEAHLAMRYGASNVDLAREVEARKNEGPLARFWRASKTNTGSLD